MKLRLFVALEIDEAVRALAQNAAAALVEAGVAGKFESPEKLHVTVAFLGHRPDSDLAEITQALRDANLDCRPFSLEFSRLGAFPNERRPRVIWIGPKLESTPFAVCAKTVRSSYTRLGFTFEHEASPHVTICRPKFALARALPALRGRAMLDVVGLTLFRSLPAGPTTRYEALERTKFPM